MSGSAAAACRLAIVLVGVAVLVVGMYSHFQSAWVHSFIKIFGTGEIRPYQFCNINFTDKHCPHIALERFFVSTIVVCFIVSLFGMVLSCLIDLRANMCLHAIDISYHILAGIALLVAAGAYIFSAEHINNLVKVIDGSSLNFRRSEKLVAGGLTIFQGLLYIVAAGVYAKS